MRLILTACVLVLDVWAISAILKEPGRRWAKAGWILAVIGLPLAGFVLWRMTSKKHLLRSERHG